MKRSCRTREGEERITSTIGARQGGSGKLVIRARAAKARCLVVSLLAKGTDQFVPVLPGLRRLLAFFRRGRVGRTVPVDLSAEQLETRPSRDDHAFLTVGQGA